MSLGFDSKRKLDDVIKQIDGNWRWAIANDERPVPAIIFGTPGVGKTESIYTLVKDKEDAVIVTLPASTLEPTDIAGALKPFDDHFKYLPPEWALPLLARNMKNKWAILFIDDVPTAPRQVQTAIFKLVHEGQFGPSNELARNILYILAGNLPEHDAGAQKILTPLASRCQLFNVVPSVEKWLDIALERNFHPTIRAAIQNMNDLLNNFDAKSLANPCPRTWEMASKNFKAAEYNNRKPNPKDIEGLVGEAATAKLFAFITSSKDALSPSQVIKDPKGVKMPEKMEAYYVTVSSLEAFTLENPEVILKVIDFFNREDCPAIDVAGAAASKIIPKITKRYIQQGEHHKFDELLTSDTFKKFTNKFPAMVRLGSELRAIKRGM